MLSVDTKNVVSYADPSTNYQLSPQSASRSSEYRLLSWDSNANKAKQTMSINERFADPIHDRSRSELTVLNDSSNLANSQRATFRLEDLQENAETSRFHLKRAIASTIAGLVIIGAGATWYCTEYSCKC
eukprot:83587_1